MAPPHWRASRLAWTHTRVSSSWLRSRAVLTRVCRRWATGPQGDHPGVRAGQHGHHDDGGGDPQDDLGPHAERIDHPVGDGLHRGHVLGDPDEVQHVALDPQQGRRTSTMPTAMATANWRGCRRWADSTRVSGNRMMVRATSAHTTLLNRAMPSWAAWRALVVHGDGAEVVVQGHAQCVLRSSGGRPRARPRPSPWGCRRRSPRISETPHRSVRAPGRSPAGSSG
jgi:hypothetical protein